MAEKRNKPEIRFKGFSDEWEDAELGNKVDFFSGLTYSPINVIDEGGTFVLRSSNVKNGEIVNADNVFVDSNVVNSDNVQLGDIIVVVRNGSRSLIGKHAQIKSKMDSTVIGAFMTGVRSKESSFINALLDTKQFNKEIEKNLGATINQITTGSFKRMKFIFPSYKEQTKIGTFFQKLDNLITQHQRKHNKLTQIKKSMLEKMFPKEGADVPEIRFKGFSDKWLECKVGDVVSSLSGGASISPGDYKNEGVRTIPKGAVNSTGIADLSGSKYISKKFFERNNSSQVSTGELVTSLRDLVPSAPNMGRLVRIEGNKENFLMPQGVYKIELINNIDKDIVIAYSNSDKYRKIISREKNGSTQVHIRNNEFLNIEIYLPSYDEQVKIGSFFSNLENFINLQQKEIEKLKNIKKASLEKMFVS